MIRATRPARRRLAAATIAGSLVLGLAATSAVAQDTPPPPSEPTTQPTAPHSDATTTTPTRPKGIEVVGYIETLIGQVEGAPIEAALKAHLLGRLRETKAKWVVGIVVEAAVMQQLIGDVRAALGVPAGADAPKGPATTHAERPKVTDAPRPKGSDAPHPGDVHPVLDQAGVLHLLEIATTKVTGSGLSDADKKALLDAIDAVRVKVTAGTGLGQEELGRLLSSVRETLERLEPPHADGDRPAGPTTGTPRERALAVIDREIAKVQASDLPDDEKAKIIAALTAAREHVSAAADAAKDIHAQIVAQRAKRLAELTARLTAMADKVSAYADHAAGLTGADAAAVSDARAKIVEAKDKLSLATTAADLRGVWLLLRAARLELSAAAHAVEAPTTAAPA